MFYLRLSRLLPSIICLCFIAIPLCPSELGAAEPKDVRIATLNLKNYLIADRYIDGTWRPSYPKPEKHKDEIRESIISLNPDILFIQEIGGPAFLEELRADLALSGLHYPFAVHMQGADQVRHMAVLSKLSPVDVVKHKHLDFKYFDRREKVKRGMLEIVFKLSDGQQFSAFAVHLKSPFTDEKADPRSHLRRAREAESCRNMVIKRTLDRNIDHYMVVGDFNDHPKSAAMRRFYKRGNLNIGRLLPISDSRGEVWTYYYPKYAHYSQVDGFVLSEKMMGRVRGQRGHIVDERRGTDHRIVYLDILSGTE